MKNKTLWILVLVFVIIVAGAYFLYNRLGSDYDAPPAASDSASDKVQAPDFTAIDINGDKVKLSDFTGKPVVLNFWASWCGPCKSEMPDFDEAYKELGGKVHFVIVNMTDGSRETFEDALSYYEKQGYSMPVYFDTKMEAATAYGVTSLPTTYFIDADGYATAKAVGAIDRETLQRGIDMILPQ